jgi:hypothetical protein
LHVLAEDQDRERGALLAQPLTRWQVLRLVGAEALKVVMLGGLLGALVAGLNLMGLWSALGVLSVWTSIEIPWATLAAALGACAVLAVVSAVALRQASPCAAGPWSWRAYASDLRPAPAGPDAAVPRSRRTPPGSRAV